MNWLDLAHDGEMWRALVNAVMSPYRSVPLWSLLNKHTNYVKYNTSFLLTQVLPLYVCYTIRPF